MLRFQSYDLGRSILACWGDAFEQSPAQIGGCRWVGGWDGFGEWAGVIAPGLGSSL